MGIGFAAAGVAAAVVLWPPRVLPVAYDLAERAPFAERWSSREVVAFGTPAAEPYLADGFHREGAGEAFVWSRREAELAFQWPAVEARSAVVELLPYAGAGPQRAEVVVNDTPVAAFNLNDSRHRYPFPIPAAAQRAGDNRVRFRFTADASPSERDPANPDRRRLAAAFSLLAVAPATDAGLDDLLGRGAPDLLEAGVEGGVPRVLQVGPSVVRHGIRLPGSAELRFTPDLHPSARAAGAVAVFRVTVEARGGAERELWSRAVRATDPPPKEVSVTLPGEPGDVVRLGLWVGAGGSGRFAWGLWKAPRVLGTGGGAGLEAPAPSAVDRARGEELRRGLAGSNVVLVILDAGRARSLGCYGYPRATTPEIDRIAAEGVVFESVYSAAVYTLGSMSSVWTSQHPDRHHSEVSFSARLPKDRLTLAEVLSAQGVATGGFVANAVAGRAFGFDRGFAEFRELYREFPEIGTRGDVFRKALPGFLSRHRDGPFFAYLHFREPHFPYDPEPPFDTRFGPEGPIARAQRRQTGWITELNQGRRKPAPDEIEHLVRLFDGNLAFADREVGELRRALEREGLWDRTVFVVSADHGEELFEHGWIGHNVHLYEPSIHVPLVVRFPKGRGPAGVRVKALADLLDLAPTIADVFGALGQAGSDREFQGRSLLDVAAGAPGKPFVLSRTVWDRPRYALRDERWKFLYDTRTGEGRLFDLGSDPGERRDLVPAEPVLTSYYRQALHATIARLAARRGPGGETFEPTGDQRENLCALGYLDCGKK